MNYNNIHEVRVRNALNNRIQAFYNVPLIEHHCRLISDLLFAIDGYDFEYIRGDIRIHHNWIHQKSDEFLLSGINNMMKRDTIFYEIPYLLNFHKRNGIYDVDITLLTGIDNTEELIDVLLI